MSVSPRLSQHIQLDTPVLKTSHFKLEVLGEAFDEVWPQRPPTQRNDVKAERWGAFR